MKLWMCLLMKSALLSVTLLNFVHAESVATPCPTSTPTVIIHEAMGPTQANTDPDFLKLLKAQAQKAVDSGRYKAELERVANSLYQAMTAPISLHPLRAATRNTEQTTKFIWPEDATPVLKPYFQDFKRTYVFIDATEPRQVKWAQRVLRDFQSKKHAPNATIRVVLTMGTLSVARQALSVPKVYFDQAGRLSGRLHVDQLPATVTLSAQGFVTRTYHVDETGARYNTVVVKRPSLTEDYGAPWHQTSSELSNALTTLGTTTP